MKKFLKDFIRGGLNFIVSRFYRKQYLKLLKFNNIPNRPCPGEKEWVNKWSVLGKANPIYFRLFSHYTKCDLNIISEDICRNIVEPILNPDRYVSYYSDKNIFDKLFGHSAMPQTIFRKMHGFYYDQNYERLNIVDNKRLTEILSKSGVRKIIIKPTVDSMSGEGVRLFEIKNGLWYATGTGEELSLDYLENFYGDNIIVQECVEQADYIAYYNPTSVNTLRLTLYRSVKNDECYITSAVIRIGKNGSFVDNAHAGGQYVGIKSDGTLCNKTLDQYGRMMTEFNGIDFTKDHKIPNWNKVIEFAKFIGRNVPHHRLLALDIMVDKSDTPRLIEFNCTSYSIWLFQFTMGAAFGEYTDEIIEYCKRNMDKANKIVVL